MTGKTDYDAHESDNDRRAIRYSSDDEGVKQHSVWSRHAVPASLATVARPSWTCSYPVACQDSRDRAAAGPGRAGTDPHRERPSSPLKAEGPQSPGGSIGLPRLSLAVPSVVPVRKGPLWGMFVHPGHENPPDHFRASGDVRLTAPQPVNSRDEFFRQAQRDRFIPTPNIFFYSHSCDPLMS